jgi:hypothetical protein
MVLGPRLWSTHRKPLKSNISPPFHARGATYRSQLRCYLDAAREWGVVPVPRTPASRRRFDGAGNAAASHGFYPDAMRALAAAAGVHLIDITAQTIALWQELGPDGSRLNFVPTDSTHFSQPGAGLVARMCPRAAGHRGPRRARRAPPRRERAGGVVHLETVPAAT